ncbi:hypothetical protein MUCCIDRAFT_105731 [Mucor lusitanicus CBS 277.49]|uniref:Uncharacterized protein n=1 Tax=Mucor lusitanicus CBS 277.49 TaxID=747725 RepID=A0A168Q6D7_MUCCL|nr:hypothetical protein MUCCIDRAFT_105731 [Mucor lusitanicus CBS 277.49]
MGKRRKRGQGKTYESLYSIRVTRVHDDNHGSQVRYTDAIKRTSTTGAGSPAALFPWPRRCGAGRRAQDTTHVYNQSDVSSSTTALMSYKTLDAQTQLSGDANTVLRHFVRIATRLL